VTVGIIQRKPVLTHASIVFGGMLTLVFCLKGRQKFLGTDIKNLYLEKLRLAAVYRRAKFRDDTTTFTDI